MSFDCDADEELQFSFARMLAALPGMSPAVSGQSAIAAPSFSFR